jgi:small subunit ribosomal protein S17
MTTDTKVQRTRTGTVVSNKMDKTIVVVVTRRLQHPVYKKYITKTTRFKAHDPENKCSIGAIVVIKESRPISKDKSWVLVEIKQSANEQNA